jgi:hypothetical protein
MLFAMGSGRYHKWFALMLTVAMFGCTVTDFGRFPKTYLGPRLPIDKVAELGQRDYSLSVPEYSIRSIDGNQIENATVIEILPGHHKVVTDVEWSNGFEDQTDLDFSAMAGKKYVVGIYELRPGEDPAKATFREPSLGKAIAMAPLKVLAIGATPIVLFFTWPAWVYIAAQERKQGPPKNRPFDHCCFVWIQDADMGETLAGVSPKTGKSAADAIHRARTVSFYRDGEAAGRMPG